MGDFCLTPFTSKPRATALCVLITLLSLLLGGAVAEESRTSHLSLRVNQLSNAFKLLQLQLKQTTETAEHVQSLLADLAQWPGDAASVHDQPGEAILLQGKKQKQDQEQDQESEQTPLSINTDGRQGISAPSHLLLKDLLPSSTEFFGCRRS